MLGTIVNTGAVVGGALIGVLIHSRMPERITKTTFQGIGLFTLYIGFSMAMKTENVLIMVFSIVLGAISGELLDIEKRMEKVSDWLKKKVGSKNDKFTEGFVTAFMLFCMGSMTILGSIEEGLGGKPTLLLAKSFLDGFGAIALASTLGIGVLFSAVPLFVYQGGLTLSAGAIQGYLTDLMISEISAVGGLLLLGMGINILEIKKLKIMNLLPALVFAALFAYFIK
ncbi:TPA: DUF554 domain-containing protein [Candidatus Delongbacteria bacterium]|nr:MAG: hypothetical protein A2Y39_03835 [Candidatus Delongbacteria bacterium GWF2_40_14]HAQ60706.1 DUF554 domain-containing protein [Candidatus Delongbacteria bacterium]